jgi:arylsulfatase A-like enzyme
MALGAKDRGERIFADGVRFLRRNRDGKFFLFLHTYKVHEPYQSSPRYEDFFGAGPEARAVVPASTRPMVDAYDRAIREADDQVAAFLWHLEELGLAERTVVAIVSDHGEAFLEHGVKGHGFGGHQEQLGVPWILRGPGVAAGLRVATPVSLVDVAPTLLGLLGAGSIAGAQGRDLSAVLAGGAAPGDAPLYFDWIGNTARGVRHGRWKYLETRGERRLYDLEADPFEQHPREPTERESELMAAHRSANRKRQQAFGKDSREVPAVRAAVRKSLEALGYIE